MVLTKAMDLEGLSAKRHTHFAKGEEFPLTIGDVLGHGGYGSVRKVYSPLSGRTYALKTFRRTKQNRREVESFMTELQILQRIDHHHCVELIASYTDPKTFGLIMSPVADCNLSMFYNRVTGNEDNQRILRTFFGCLAHALWFLHDSKIRHRDIKPENILVKGSEVYLADFGVSLDWANLVRSTTTEDSAKSWIYCAPEVAKLQKRNSSADIWSLGCVFIEMLTVLKGFTAHDLREKFRAHSERPRYYENLDVAMEWVADISGCGIDPEKEVIKWIHEMVVIEPSSRTTALVLSSSIAKFGKKSGDEEGVNLFCCERCYQYHESDAPSDEDEDEDEASDDDVWAEALAADTTTPATSPPATNPNRRHDASSLKLNKISRATPSTPIMPAGVESSQLSDFEEDERLDDHNRADAGLRGITDLQKPEHDDSDQSKANPPMGDSCCEVPKEADTKNALSSLTPEEPTPVAIDECINCDDSNGNPKAHSVIKGDAPLKSRYKIRLELIEKITKDRSWPFTDTRGRLPALSARSWHTPTLFLKSVQSDIPFMEYLRSADASQFERFKAAGTEDLFPIIHLLLVNGLDINHDVVKVLEQAIRERKQKR
ncbi:hypothetical protein N0V83_000313 [Neocucurbitaria cava]|uniref:Protein kinase domain-containing protein n=1 Tax=Neocucurbitaria cava TaxID=798079 RepID=A0A9W8YIF7_9PLEO|nr:hypothetical protein N0V83_000313 [Neocucurbitaria cava]